MIRVIYYALFSRELKKNIEIFLLDIGTFKIKKFWDHVTCVCNMSVGPLSKGVIWTDKQDLSY